VALQFSKLASLDSLLNMQMLVTMVRVRETGGSVRKGDEYCLKKRVRLYKVVKPRASFMDMGRAAGVRGSDRTKFLQVYHPGWWWRWEMYARIGRTVSWLYKGWIRGVYACLQEVWRRMTEMVYEYFFSILFETILDQISGEKHLKLSLAEFVYILAAVTFFSGWER
jgi:hypothetical protein